MRKGLEAIAQERQDANRQRVAMLGSVPLESFLAQGLMEAQSLLVLDLERCTRCDQCVRACADAHDGVTRLVREGLRFDKYLSPLPAASAAIRSAWSAVRSARFAAAIRSK